jgi:pilus assembly protein FimV
MKRTDTYCGFGDMGLTRLVLSQNLCAARRALTAIGWLGSVSIVCFHSSADAISLGAEQVTSTLGQPLRMVVPLLGETTDSLEARCFRVVAPAKTDGLLVVTQARIELQTTTNPPQLIVRSNRSIDEPIVRLSIEAGCDAPIRREYTLLLDPPTGQPLAETRPLAMGSLPQAASALSSEPVRGSKIEMNPLATETSAQRDEPVRRASDKSKSPMPTERRAARSKLAESRLTTPGKKEPNASPPLDQLKVLASNGEANASVGDAALAALAVPRLRISDALSITSPPVTAGGAAVTDELQAAIAKDRRARLLATPIDSDLAPRLEADLVVAQRRLAELQAQLSAPGAATMTKSAATPTVATTAESAVSRWTWVSWMWIPGLALIAGLIGFLLLQRRSQAPTKFEAQFADNAVYVADEDRSARLPEPSAEAAFAALQPAAVTFDAPPRATPPAAKPVVATTKLPAAAKAPAGAANPIIATRAEREASDRLNNPLFQLRDTESHVDVTELSQVTEEAQVYADLGRNDQAIELLRHHIDTQSGDRASPAPWLMIFELYRRTNNRVGYNELAPQFRLLFNGRVPDWDNYGHELALDDGLEAFPHLIARIERDWGTGEARKFLEELLYDNRGGSRLGFSLAAYRDILLLLQVHEGLGAAPDFATSDWESRGANDADGTPKWDLALDMIEPPQPGELESFLNRPPADKN